MYVRKFPFYPKRHAWKLWSFKSAWTNIFTVKKETLGILKYNYSQNLIYSPLLITKCKSTHNINFTSAFKPKLLTSFLIFSRLCIKFSGKWVNSRSMKIESTKKYFKACKKIKQRRSKCWRILLTLFFLSSNIHVNRNSIYLCLICNALLIQFGIFIWLIKAYLTKKYARVSWIN